MNPILKRVLGRRKFALASVLVLALSLPAFADGDPDSDANFDRMDGTGTSGKTVNVIEWEGNLEIHVAPPGSLKGLALKLDKVSKSKTVMVIGYRFDNDPGKQLVRRAILGIDIHDGFKVYRDKTVAEYDKIVITNNTLGGSDLVAFRLDPDPKQLYPDGHPMLANQQQQPPQQDNRAPASAPKADAATAAKKARAARARLEEDGTIQPFFGARGHQQAGTVTPSGADGDEQVDE